MLLTVLAMISSPVLLSANESAGNWRVDRGGSYPAHGMTGHGMSAQGKFAPRFPPLESSRGHAATSNDGGNPWALPEVTDPAIKADFPEVKKYRGGNSSSSEHTDAGSSSEAGTKAGANARAKANTRAGESWNQYQGGFVSPQFLQSLKEQQQSYQRPWSGYYQGGYQGNYNAPGTAQPSPPAWTQGTGVTGTPGYHGAQGQDMRSRDLQDRALHGPALQNPALQNPALKNPAYRDNLYLPSPGGNSFNPLFDAPAASPWLADPGKLFRGQSFSYIPDEAIGGIPPMRTPGFGPGGIPGGSPGGGFGSGFGDMGDFMPDQVFNPFTFLNDTAPGK